MIDISKLKTPEECLIFEKNVIERNRPDLALAARKRSLELRSIAHNTTSDVERDCLAAIYAYEDILSAKNNRKTRATRTWQMISKHGLIEAFERVVNRPGNTIGYDSLLKQGLEHFAYENVVLRHVNSFSETAVNRAKQRQAEATALSSNDPIPNSS